MPRQTTSYPLRSEERSAKGSLIVLIVSRATRKPAASRQGANHYLGHVRIKSAEGFYPMSRSRRNAKGDSAGSGKTTKNVAISEACKSPMSLCARRAFKYFQLDSMLLIVYNLRVALPAFRVAEKYQFRNYAQSSSGSRKLLCAIN
jgi:hypothetical protein